MLLHPQITLSPSLCVSPGDISIHGEVYQTREVLVDAPARHIQKRSKQPSVPAPLSSFRIESNGKTAQRRGGSGVSRDRFLVRRMGREEVEIAVDWAEQEGWNPGIHDAEEIFLTLSAQVPGERRSTSIRLNQTPKPWRLPAGTEWSPSLRRPGSKRRQSLTCHLPRSSA
jgi:hypothetical protein